jgi:hypothetical protein
MDGTKTSQIVSRLTLTSCKSDVQCSKMDMCDTWCDSCQSYSVRLNVLVFLFYSFCKKLHVHGY